MCVYADITHVVRMQKHRISKEIPIVYTGDWKNRKNVHILFWILCHYMLLQDIEYSVWCYTVGLVVYFIPWTEEPGRLQSMGLLRVGHD